MKFNTKLLIFLSSFLIIVTLISILIRLDKDRDVQNDPGNPQIQGITDYSTYPVIQNIPPSTVIVGEGYIYDLAVIDSDTHYTSIRLEIVEGPNWLVVNNLTLLGSPSLIDVGEHKVVIKLSDGTNNVYKTFYILVESPYETE